MQRLRTAALAAGVAVAALVHPAHAQSVDEPWKFQVVIYAWLPDISGDTRFATPSGSPSINIDVSQILKNLNFTLMGEFEAKKGKLGVFTDLVYMDVSGSKSGTRDFGLGGGPIGPSLNLDGHLDLKSAIWTIAGEYNLASDPQFSMDLLGGARLLSMKQDLSYQLNGDLGPIVFPVRSGSSNVKVDDWDGIVGVKGRVVLDAEHKWFVPYYVDVGGGDSKLTWQGILGLGYSFKWGDVIAAWRYLDYEFKSSSPIDKAHFSGPAIGAAFHW